jgi:hypothetical protein
LLAFVVRSLIPAGFMPAADRPFTLEICPDGLPAHVALPAHADDAVHLHDHASVAAERAGDMHATEAGEHSAPHDPHSTHKSWTHCPFAGLASAPAPLHVAEAAPSLSLTAVAISDTDARFVSTTRFRIAQPRAPPSLPV